MKRSSPFLFSLLIIPVLAVIAALGIFSWLSVQHADTDNPVAQSSQYDNDRGTGRQNQSVSGSNAVSTNTDVTQSTVPLDKSAVTSESSSDLDAADTENLQQLTHADGEAIVVTGIDDSDNDPDALTLDTREDIALEDSLNPDDDGAENEAAESEESDVPSSEQADDDAESIENKGTEVLAGRVIDQRGAPISSLAVTASRRDDNRSYSSTARTDINGRFEYRDIATGEYLLKTATSSTYPSVSQYARSGGTSTTIVVSRQYRVQVVGRITDQGGRPIVGADVAAPGGQTQTKSDTSGAYRIAVDSTDRQGFVLRFVAAGYIEELQRVDVKAAAGQVVANIELRALGNLSVSGQVFDPQSSPLERALVQVSSSERNFHESTQSDKDGRFSLTGLPPARDYRIKASSSDEYGIWMRENVDISTSQDLSITLPGVGSGRVVGSIVDTNQFPLPDFSLLAVRGGSDGRVVEFKSDESGFFEIDNFVADKLSFVSKSSPSIQINGASVADGEEAQLTLVVNVGTYELTGTVVREGSQDPLQGARLTMTWQQQSGRLNSRVSHSTTSDSDGTFRFSNLGDGDWTLGISADGYQTQSRPIQPASLSTLPAIFLKPVN